MSKFKEIILVITQKGVKIDEEKRGEQQRHAKEIGQTCKMKESNLALSFCSALLAFFLGFFFLLVFIEIGSLTFAVFVNFIFLLVTFSPLRKLFLGEMVRFFQVLFASSLAAMTSILVFITIPLSIGEYYDRKAALTPSWVYYLSMYMGIAGIVLGFISAYFVFKKYYRK